MKDVRPRSTHACFVSYSTACGLPVSLVDVAPDPKDSTCKRCQKAMAAQKRDAKGQTDA